MPRVVLPLFAVVFACATLAGEHEKLSAVEASRLAAQLANQDCQRRFGASPFEASASTASFAHGRWHWKAAAGYGRGDVVADISFTALGDSRAVRVNLMDNRR